MNRHPNTISRETCGLLVIDVQEKFAPVIPGFDAIVQNIVRLILGFQMFERPILVTEQYPKGLGATLDIIARQFDVIELTEKMHLSCCRSEGFTAKLDAHSLEHIIVTGVESHVCVNQTVLDLISLGKKVHIVVDAIGARRAIDHETAISKMVQAGAVPATTEMALFELAQKAGTQEFKNIQKMVKSKLKSSFAQGPGPARADSLKKADNEPVSGDIIIEEEMVTDALLDTVPAGHLEAMPPALEKDVQKEHPIPVPNLESDSDITSLDDILGMTGADKPDPSDKKPNMGDTRELSKAEIDGLDIETLENILGSDSEETTKP